MALHPQARALLEQAAQSDQTPLYELDPPAARAQAAIMTEFVGAGPELPQVQDLQISVAGATIGVRRYVPEQVTGTIVWLHGGGWVIGDLDSHDAMCRMLARESKCEVIAVDYRRAPEHPFPVPLEDCWEALGWAADQAAGRPLILGGDSAGGNMAAVCALRARDRDGPALTLQVLVYPVTDYEMASPSYVEYGTGPDTYLTTDEMSWFWEQYIPEPDARGNPEASPLRADHAGVAPAVVVTAGHDPLRNDGLAYVEALRAAGVRVAHHAYDDMIHSFFALVNVLERGDEAVARVGGEIRAAVARAGAPAK